MHIPQSCTNPEDEALPSAKEAQFVASSLPFLPVCGQESPTHLRRRNKRARFTFTEPDSSHQLKTNWR